MSTALVLVHPGSIGSYAFNGGEDPDRLANAMVIAAQEHDGPVVIVDQNWGNDFAAQAIMRRLAPEATLILEFDEAKRSWGRFLPKLRRALQELGADSVIVGGIWWGSAGSGCARAVHDYLLEKMGLGQVTADPSILGIEPWS